MGSLSAQAQADDQSNVYDARNITPNTSMDEVDDNGSFKRSRNDRERHGKVDTDSKDHLGKTPLSFAPHNGHEAVITLPFEIKYRRRTPLFHAMQDVHETPVDAEKSSHGQTSCRGEFKRNR